MITGKIQTTKSNDWGFTSYKVNGTWYGADTKGPPRASEGENVSFEAFDKPGKDGRTWPTIKLASFKKGGGDAGAGGNAPAAAPVSNGSPRSGSASGSASNRDSYWSDKAAEDKLREPRIVYQASYERAIQFVDLAIKNGAFAALEKAKPTAKLEVLQAFVDEQTDRIMRGAFTATVPASKQPVPDAAAPVDEAGNVASDDSEWS